MATVVAFGECMAELRPLGEGRWQQGFAGDTFNTAAYLRRLDREGRHTIEYACGLGDDPFAPQMLDLWRQEGVGDRFTRRVPGRTTGLYAISVDPNGERQFSYWRDTSAARGYFDVPETPLEARQDEIDVMYISGISLGILPTASVDRLLTLCGRLKARGAKVVFDNNYRPRQWSSAKAAWGTMKRCLESCDIALLTLDDQLSLNESSDAEEVIAASMNLDVDEVVIKRGTLPTLVRDSHGRSSSVKVAAVKPVDTTAAGDSFAAGYLYGRLSGADPTAAAELGNALAGRVVQHPGALMPSVALEADRDFWQIRELCATA
jgi:2-dehydro-3-deoxygluconokinase